MDGLTKPRFVAYSDQLSCISRNQMVGQLIIGFAWRHDLFLMAPMGGAIFLETPKIWKFMSEFSSSHQYIFHIILEYIKVCEQKLD